MEEEDCKEKKVIIDNKTAISITLMGGVVAIVWFLSGLYSDVQASKVRLDRVETALEQINKIEIQISSMSSKIDGLTKLLVK